MAKEKMKSYGEQRAGERFGLLSNETIKMKSFFPHIMEDIYPHVDTTWEISNWWSDSKAMTAAFNAWNKSLQKESELNLEGPRVMIFKCRAREV